MTDAEDELLRSRRDGVETITINRPQVRNALTRSLLGSIAAAMAEADADPAVRVVVLAASGTAAFCAGMDLRELAVAAPAALAAAPSGTAADFGTFLREGISKPLICAAVGTAVGGGFELVLACDIVVASQEARFGLTEVKRGLIPGGSGILIGRRLPLPLALELTLTGDLLGAEDAQRLGLINRVVPPESVIAEAQALARAIAANAPLAVRAIKQLVRAAADRPLDEVWALQSQVRPLVFESEDAREGAAAFVERRSPIWKGR